jgi:hypothetical protein
VPGESPLATEKLSLERGRVEILRFGHGVSLPASQPGNFGGEPQLGCGWISQRIGDQ